MIVTALSAPNRVQANVTLPPRLYGRRTGSVRVPTLVARPRALQIGRMTENHPLSARAHDRFTRWVLQLVHDVGDALKAVSLRAFHHFRTDAARVAREPERLAALPDDPRWLEMAMKSLPAHSRELLVLRELKGLSCHEIAATLDIPVGEVLSSLSRAHQDFRAATDCLVRSYTDSRRHPAPGEDAEGAPDSRQHRAEEGP